MPGSPATDATRSHNEYSEERYRDAHGIIVMCMRCRCTRRKPPEEEKWELVQEHLEHRPRGVSDGICHECLEQYYSELGAPHIQAPEAGNEVSAKV